MRGLVLAAGLAFLVLLAAARGESAGSPAPADTVLTASPEAIAADPALTAYVERAAGAAVAEHCARCHGADLRGGSGPNLLDGEWLWGIRGDETSKAGPVGEIQQTIAHGVRNHDCAAALRDAHFKSVCADSRFTDMPAYGLEGEFPENRILDLADYVLHLSGRPVDPVVVARTRPLFETRCSACHGREGHGNPTFGGPDLTNDTWLYGGDRATVARVIREGGGRRCPAWADRLDAATLKAIAVYIWARAVE